MTDSHDFPAGRDAALGALLRAHLEGADDAAFAARMREAAVAAAAEGEWRRVGRWALPGLAAAALLLLALAGALRPADQGTQQAASPAGSLVELASDTAAGGSGALLAVMSY